MIYHLLRRFKFSACLKVGVGMSCVVPEILTSRSGHRPMPQASAAFARDSEEIEGHGWPEREIKHRLAIKVITVIIIIIIIIVIVVIIT